MQQASREVKNAELSIMGAARTYKTEMTTIGLAATGAGLAVASGFGMAAKAAIDWESAFAGVRKTVDGTAEELDALEQGLRSLAGEIPVSHIELAAIAEAAGQLGIESGNILDFTETMAALGVTTNLTSTEAATMFARFANITGLPQDQIDNIGSAVVDLGNNLATTEAEIGDMALRLAGAGTQIGLTEPEILGFAGALSSVGIEAEAGGTAISRVFVEVDKAVRAGGDSLEAFGATAGMSGEQFRQAYETDAAGAIVTFIEGLKGISTSGGDVFGVLEDLELGDRRVSDALLRAAGAGDLFRDSIDRSSEAFEANTALTKEAEQRYETVASLIQDTKNAMFELGITVGDIVLPVIVPLIQAAGDLAEWFGDLPDPIQKTAVALGIAGAALLTIGGTVALILPRIVALTDAYVKLKAAVIAGQAAQAASAAGAGAGGIAGAAAGARAGLNASTVAKATVYAGAAWATTEAVQAGFALADQMDQGQADLADRVADLIIAAENGDQEAAKKLTDFRDTMVENRSWWDRNSPTGLGFQASRIWAQGQDLADQRQAEYAIGRLDTVVGAGMGTVGGIPVVAQFEAVGAAAERYASGIGIAIAANATFRDRTNEAAQAQMGLITAMNLSFSESGRAIAALQAMDAAKAHRDQVLADPEATVEEVAAAQFAYAESIYAAQGAIDAMSTESLESTIEGLSEALGISRDEARELLDTLDLLDGKEIHTVITIAANRLDTVVAAGVNTIGGVPLVSNPLAGIDRRAAGGPMTSGSLYQVGEGNRPELFAGAGGLYMVPGDSGRMLTMNDLAGGGGIHMTNTFHIRESSNPQATGRAVVREISRELEKYRGGAKRLIVDG
jgi:TP901 family phage tail tape measure protein